MTIKRTPFIYGIAILLLAAVGLYRWWQGPQVPAYQLQPTDLIQNVVATGRVISTSRAQVGSEITGIVTERRVKEGDRVHPGDILIVLRADDLMAKEKEAQAALDQLRLARRPQAIAALAQAESQFAQATRETKRRTELLEKQSIAQEAVEQSKNALATARAAVEQARLLVQSLAPDESEERILKERLAAAQAMLLKTVIRSEVSGTILTRNVEPGDLVQPAGKVLLEIARAGDTEILIPLDERNLATLALGQSATCVADAYPDKYFDARVNFIAPTIDPQRGTVDIRLKVDPVPEYLRQDMTVSVNILTGQVNQALAVPNDALLNIRGTQADVMVVRDGRAQRVGITLGLRGLAHSQASSGLTPGEWVVQGSKVQEGERVRVSPQILPLSQFASTTRKETPVKFN
jgi:HlyD family secretion protein